MMPDDFVFNQIFKGALNQKASERCAHNNALLGLEDYKKNRIASKVSKLIQDRIKRAVADTKKSR